MGSEAVTAELGVMLDKERLWQAMLAVAPSMVPACFEQQVQLAPSGPHKVNFNLGHLQQLTLAAGKAMVDAWKQEMAACVQPMSMDEAEKRAVTS